MKRWRGLKALVHDAIDATTDVVGEGHAAAHRGVRRAAALVPGAEPVGLVSDGVELATKGTLGTVKAVNRVVETLLDGAIDLAAPLDGPQGPPIPLRSDAVGSAAWVADAALGAVNGTVGDHLARTGNHLDLGLQLRHADRYLGAGDRLDAPTLLLVHGLGTTEWCWSLEAEAAFGDPTATLGTELHTALGLQPVYARYNTGRRIHENGRALAEALEAHAAHLDRLVLLGHSMGGLVVRAACHHAEQAGHRWLRIVDDVVSLGTPHRGAPLARFGARATAALDGVDLPTTRVLARVLSVRSAGVRDLEWGDVHGIDPDADATAEERVVPLLDGIRYSFLGTTLTPSPDHPVGVLMGDLLVRPGSAEGPLQHEPFPVHSEMVGGVLHHRIQSDPRIRDRVVELLGPR